MGAVTVRRSSPRCVCCKGLIAGPVCPAWDTCGLAVLVCAACCRAEGGAGDDWVTACGRLAVAGGATCRGGA